MTCGPDIHAGSLPNRLQTLKNLDVTGVVSVFCQTTRPLSYPAVC